MNEKNNRETTLYPNILKWLQEYLENKNKNAEVKTHDVHSIDLGEFFEQSKYKKFFPEYPTYKIRVDLLGTVIKNNKCELTFIEVKNKSISLINLSQLLGYCKILKPKFAFLISPSGLSKPMRQLLTHFNRLDILEFDKNKSITVAKWNISRNAIDISSAIPPFTSP